MLWKRSLVSIRMALDLVEYVLHFFAYSSFSHFFPDCLCLFGFQNTLKALAGIPLSEDIDLSQFVAMRPHTETAGSTLPFNLSQHPLVCKSHIALVTIDRLQTDVAGYARGYNSGVEPELLRFEDADVKKFAANPKGLEAKAALDQVQALMNALRDLASKDAEYVTKIIGYILGGLNASIRSDQKTRPGTQEDAVARARICHSLACHSGQETPIWFELMVAFILSSDAEKDLRMLSPLCSLVGAQRALQLTANVLFHANRNAQARRCISQARELMLSLEQLRAHPETATPADWASLVLQGERLATSLTAERHYIHLDDPHNPTKGIFDPRFLVFEFTHNLLLRPSQVELVTTIVQTVALNNADPTKTAGICHQVSLKH